MITASEARERIHNLGTKRGEREKLAAEVAIISAIEKQDSSCYLSFRPSDETVKWLRSLGYHVDQYFVMYSGNRTMVSW